ncbi:hypothetical protein [Bradyrhizobium sp. CCBAU 51753]|uniref:hypothetical protein n=1 Tax=Bradyrhizobium sp. CCBAU 51753 TaxID=1325100 RepID=UPI00188D3197|nr:hypothetical protein [Bradyrhizobium sp. CCBAU 51753]QOZ28162.1 hypothetical protein XH93_34545 [Bradyrhizobium sp. CCBAU 51753]
MVFRTLAYRTSAYRTSVALAASVGVAALLASSTESFARSGSAQAQGPRGGFAPSRPAHPGFRHHGRGVSTFWPGYGYDNGPYSSEPLAQAIPAVSNDYRYTYTYDVPWDWAHRYPPAVVPSDRPYVSSCPTESVTVPGRGGDRTINITRCY